MRKLFALLLIGAITAFSQTVSAQIMRKTIVDFGAPRVSCAAPMYTGPGDIVGGAFIWAGLRAYKASTVCTPAIQVTRVTDSATHDVSTTYTGDLNSADAASFGGTDASCTGTISGTTLSVTACSPSSFHALDQISGVGITQPAFITAVGTCASPPGTCTLNASQSVAVGETITVSVALAISKLYDQSGGNNCSSSSCTFTGGIGADNTPYLMLNCVNTTKPCAIFNGHDNVSPKTATIASLAQPFTISDVSERISTTGYQWVLGWAGNSDGVAYNNDNTNRVLLFSNSPTVAAATGSLHAVQNVVNGASSYLTVDSATPSTVNAGTGAPGATMLFWGQNGFGNQMVNGIINEIGIWSSALSSGQQTSLYSNQHTYWGTL